MELANQPLPIIAFSHLRWEAVYERPQQILSRLAARRPIVVIEEPIFDPGSVPFWEYHQPVSNVKVYRPHTPVNAPGFCTSQYSALSELGAKLSVMEDLQPAVGWLDTPMALSIAAVFDLEVVVYDCMDELAQCLHAPVPLLKHEAALLQWADLIFTSSPSLYRAKRGRHPRVHCFPDNIDAAHFRQAVPGEAARAIEAPDQARLPTPRLGFYGVIDRRLNLALLDALAGAHPEWQVVLVGPVKIDPSSLPRQPNLHYVGQRRYADLPRYLAGWDACLLPYHRNAAASPVNPSQTLEYMAAERMIVSAATAEAAGPYGDIIFRGDPPAGFIAACERALAASPAERARRVEKMRGVLARASWENTAAAMERLIEEAVEQRERDRQRVGWPLRPLVDYLGTPG